MYVKWFFLLCNFINYLKSQVKMGFEIINLEFIIINPKLMYFEIIMTFS